MGVSCFILDCWELAYLCIQAVLLGESAPLRLCYLPTAGKNIKAFTDKVAYLANRHVNRPVFETCLCVRTSALCSFLGSGVKMKGSS